MNAANPFGKVRAFDSIATKIHGMKVVCPSTPLDAYGLMLAAIKDDDPVLFLKPKALLRVKGEEQSRRFRFHFSIT